MSLTRREALRRARRTATDAAQPVLAVGFVLVGLALTTMMAWPIFQTWRLALIACFCGLFGSALAVASRRWRPVTSVLALVVLYLLAVVPLAIPSALQSPATIVVGLRDGITGIVLGWRQLLTLQVPVGDYQAVLVPFFVVALVGTVSAVRVALVPGRAAAWAIPIVLGGGVFGVAFATTDPGRPFVLAGIQIDAPREVLLGVLMVAVSMAWLSLRSRMQRRAALRLARSTASVRVQRRSAGVAARRRLLGFALIVCALVAGAAAVPTFSGVALRTTLRTGAEPTLVLEGRPSPLSTYRASFRKQQYSRPMFRVTGDSRGIDRIAIAVLSQWNGQVFSVGSTGSQTRFTRLPGGVPAAGAHRLTIAIQSEMGIWTPMPDGLSSAPSFAGLRANALAAGFYLDRNSGAAIDIAGTGTSRGLAPGDSYTVQVPPSAHPSLGAPAAHALLDPSAYPEMTAWIKHQHQPRTAGGLQTLLSRLRQRGYLSHSLEENAQASEWINALKKSAPYTFQASYAGHSAARIEDLFKQLLDQQTQVGANADQNALVAGVGDDEQFAVAGALLARMSGYDSRVVLGVRLTTLPGSGVPACTGECEGRNLAAWVQVKSPTSAAWTTIDVEPQYRQPPALVRIGEQLPKYPTVPEQKQADTVQPPDAQHGGTSVAGHAAEQMPAWLVVLLRVAAAFGLTLAAIVLLALPFMALVMVKLFRRRRRRGEAVPEVAIVGAWAEVQDAWADAGISVAGRTRLAQAASVGSESAIRLAELVDAAVFAQHPPGKDAARRAWRLAEQERRRLWAATGLGRRALVAVHPRSLLRPLLDAVLRIRERSKETPA